MSNANKERIRAMSGVIYLGSGIDSKTGPSRAIEDLVALHLIPKQPTDLPPEIRAKGLAATMDDIVNQLSHWRDFSQAQQQLIFNHVGIIETDTTNIVVQDPKKTLTLQRKAIQFINRIDRLYHMALISDQDRTFLEHPMPTLRAALQIPTQEENKKPALEYAAERAQEILVQEERSILGYKNSLHHEKNIVGVLSERNPNLSQNLENILSLYGYLYLGIGKEFFDDKPAIMTRIAALFKLSSTTVRSLTHDEPFTGISDEVELLLMTPLPPDIQQKGIGGMFRRYIDDLSGKVKYRMDTFEKEEILGISLYIGHVFFILNTDLADDKNFIKYKTKLLDSLLKIKNSDKAPSMIDMMFYSDGQKKIIDDLYNLV